jgi:hypothetical protein
MIASDQQSIQNADSICRRANCGIVLIDDNFASVVSGREASRIAITLATVVLMQAGSVVIRRLRRFSGAHAGRFRNNLILLGVAVETAFSWGILYSPQLHEFLGTGPVNWHIYAIAWFGIPLLFFLDFARKKALIALARTAVIQ